MQQLKSHRCTGACTLFWILLVAGSVAESATLVADYCVENTGTECTTGEPYGLWIPGVERGESDRTYEFDAGATFSQNDDGTAVLVGTATLDGSKGYFVEVNFGGRTSVAPSGSPKEDYCAWDPDTSSYYYYTTIEGTLSGLPGTSLAGAVITLTRRGPAFQVGVGANLQEHVLGASGWFDWELVSPATGGADLKESGHGDFNFNLVACDPTEPNCENNVPELTTFDSRTRAENPANLAAFIAAICDLAPDRVIDFEAGFADGQYIGAGNFLTDYRVRIYSEEHSPAHDDVEIRGNLAGSTPIGNLGAVVWTELKSSYIDFSEHPVDYVGFYLTDVGFDNFGIDIEYTDGSKDTIVSDSTGENCTCEEFVGIVAEPGKKIRRISINPNQFTGDYGIDNIVFGDCEGCCIEQDPVLGGVPGDLVLDCTDPIPDPAVVVAVDFEGNSLPVVFEESSTGGACDRIITRVWTAIDSCENEVSATQTIVVVDTEAPIFTSIPEDEYIECKPPVINCEPCDGGVTSLTLLYAGSAGQVTIRDDRAVYFQGALVPGEAVTINGTRSDGRFEKNELKLYVGNVENVRIHVSCSKPIGVGMVFGDFTVLAGTSRNGGALCPMDGGDPGCGACEGGITRLVLQYGGSAGQVVIRDNRETYFSGSVQTGELIEINGTKSDGKFEKNELTLSVDGHEDTRIHVSCSKPVDIGMVFGSFLVVDGSSRNGGSFCPDDGTARCGVCKGGVTRLVLQYGGSVGQVVIRDDRETYFSGSVQTGELIEINGTKSDGKFEKNELTLSVDGHEDARIHVSCSKPIDIGLAFGSFLVVDGASKDNGSFCPPDGGIIPPIITAVDNCDPNVEVVFTETSNTVNCAGIITRTWTATDACGNSTSVTQNIIHGDVTPPVLSGVPLDAEYTCVADVPLPPVVTVDDNCDDDLVVLYEEIVEGVCPTIITRVWTAIDSCGNEVSATQTTIVSDTEAPVFTGITDRTITLDCDDPDPEIPVVHAVDNCAGDITVLPVVRSGGDACRSETVLTWTAADACGNSNTVTWTIIRVCEDFTLVCPDDMVVNCDEGADPALTGEPSATSTCTPVVSITYIDHVISCSNGVYSAAQGTSRGAEFDGDPCCAGEKIIIRRWTATTANGDVLTCEQVIRLIDNTPPVIACEPGDHVQCVGDVPGPDFTRVTAWDACSDPVVTVIETNLTGTVCNGRVDYVFAARDACGNVATCTQTWYITDTQPPVLVGISNRVFNLACDDPDPVIPPVAVTDNCDNEVTVQHSTTNSDDTCHSQQVLTWTPVDVCGNVGDTVTWIINRSDDAAPVLVVGGDIDITVGDCTYTIPNLLVSVTDACTSASGIVVTQHPAPGTVVRGPVELVVTLVASDACDSTTKTVNVKVSCLPLASLGDYVWLDEDQDGCQDSSEPGVDGVTVTLYESIGGVPVNNLGSKLTDGNGAYLFTDLDPNEDYMVEFTLPPGFVFTQQGVPADDSKDSDASPSTGRTGQIELDPGENDLTNDAGLVRVLPGLLVGVSDPGCNCAGAPIDLTIHVENTGNTTLLDVEVIDATFPICSRFIGTLAAGISTSYVCTVIAPASTVTNSVVVTANDLTGSTVTKNSDFTMDVDTLPPIIVNCPPGGFVECLADVPAPQMPQALDNCDAAVDVTVSTAIENGSRPCVKKVIYTYTATDDCGNQASCTETWTVEDLSPPLIVGVSNQTFNLSCDDPDPVISPVSAIDNCEQVTVSIVSNVVGDVCNSTKTITFSAVDACNNTARVVWIINKTDTTPPVLSCPALQPVLGDANCEGVIPDVVPAVVATDNCGNPVTVVQSPAPGTKVGLGTHIITVTATDSCGLASTCKITLEVLPVSGAIGDTVWNDIDADGIQDPGEPPVDGVTVRLRGPGGVLVGTDVTAGGGQYLFTHVAAGTYSVEFVLPPGFAAFTLKGSGASDVDSNANPDGSTDSFIISCGETNRTVDAGLVGTGAIACKVTSNPPLVSGIETPVGSDHFVSAATVTWTVEVSNPTQIGLENIAVTDTRCGVLPLQVGDTDNDSILDPGETWIYTCADVNPTFSRGSNISNVVTVSGIDLVGTPVGSSCQAELVTVGINMEKRAPAACAGDQVTYTLVTRMVNGDPGVQLRNIQVVDNLCTNLILVPGSDKNNNGFLDFGEAFTSTCSRVVSQTHTNMAMDFADVYFDGVYSGMVNSEASVVVPVDQPGLALSAVVQNLPVLSGGGAIVEVTVSNTGNVDLHNVLVSNDNPDFGACDFTMATLPVGGVETRTCISFPLFGFVVNPMGVTAASAHGCAASDGFTLEIETETVPEEAIAGTLFCDADGDGVEDLSETNGLPGVRVDLLRDGFPFLTTTTDAEGGYEFPTVQTGNYAIVVSAADPGLSNALIGPNSALVNPVTLADQDQIVDIGFVIANATIDGFLFESLDKSGAPNNFALTGFNGIEVILKQVTGTGVVEVDRATTAANGSDNGYYAFTGKVGGRYLVETVAAQVEAAMIARKRAANPKFLRLAEFIDTSPGGEIITFCENGSQNLSFFASIQTAIRLASLGAEVEGEHVVVNWTTASETRNLGFNVYRSSSVNGQQTMVNASMILARGTGVGAVYSTLDVKPGAGRYFYWLEDVDLYGKATRHGPVPVLVGADAEMKGGFDVVKSGMAKVTHAVLAGSGLADDARVAVFADGVEIPALVADGDYLLFYIREGVKRIEFGLKADPKRMEHLELIQE